MSCTCVYPEPGNTNIWNPGPSCSSECGSRSGSPCVTNAGCTGQNNTCFQEGTNIETAEGLKSIESIGIGDIVKSYDIENDKVIESKVYETLEHKDIDNGLLLNGIIKTTTNHPFYSDGQWVEASDLKPGDKILHIDGEEHLVESIEYLNYSTTVYNLEIEDTHNYFAEGYLVHNKVPPWQGGGGGGGVGPIDPGSGQGEGAPKGWELWGGSSGMGTRPVCQRGYEMRNGVCKKVTGVRRGRPGNRSGSLLSQARKEVAKIPRHELSAIQAEVDAYLLGQNIGPGFDYDLDCAAICLGVGQMGCTSQTFFQMFPPTCDCNCCSLSGYGGNPDMGIGANWSCDCAGCGWAYWSCIAACVFWGSSGGNINKKRAKGEGDHQGGEGPKTWNRRGGRLPRRRKPGRR